MAGDLLISKRQICHGAFGIVPFFLEGAIVSNEYTVFRNNEGHSLKFVDYLCTLPKMNHTFYLSSIGVHIEKMLFKVEDWLKWEMPFPSLPEQQKIAAFLSAVDRKIQLLERKKALLEQYKKGVMQQLFSQTIRFTDEGGRFYPAWKESVLKNLVEKKRKIRYGIVQPGKYDENGRFLIRGKDYSFGWESPNGFFKVSDDIESKYKRARVRAGDVIACIVGSVGKVAIVPGWLDGANITQTTARIAAQRELLHNEYLYNYLQSPKGQAMIHKHVRVGTRPGLNIEDVEIFTISVPHLNEQQQIAKFLRTLDSKLHGVRAQIDSTNLFKKGLLQQMFV